MAGATCVSFDDKATAPRASLIAGGGVEIARKNWFGAIDALSCIAMVEVAERSNALQDISHPAHRAADLAIRALLARILLWTCKAFDPFQKVGDQQLRVAFEAMQEHPEIRGELSSTLQAAALQSAEEAWGSLVDDAREPMARHYRNKFVAHLSMPDPAREIPEVSSVFSLTRDVARCCEHLFHATDGSTVSMEAQVATLVRSAEAFWNPRPLP